MKAIRLHRAIVYCDAGGGRGCQLLFSDFIHSQSTSQFLDTQGLCLIALIFPEQFFNQQHFFHLNFSALCMQHDAFRAADITPIVQSTNARPLSADTSLISLTGNINLYVQNIPNRVIDFCNCFPVYDRSIHIGLELFRISTSFPTWHLPYCVQMERLHTTLGE